MKVKELIKELKKFKGEDEVKIDYNYTEHSCGDNYCYCSSEDHVLRIQTIDYSEDLRVYGFNKHGKNKESAVVIEVSQY